MTKITRRAPASGPGGVTSGTLEGDLTERQLALVGLIVLEWNEIEFLIQTMAYIALNLPAQHWISIAVSIPHASAVELIKESFRSLQLPEQMADAIDTSLRASSAVKQSRDGVTHARVVNGHLAVGGNIKRGGNSLHFQETNLSDEALTHLREHMKLVRRELTWSINLIDMWKGMSPLLHPRTGRQPLPEEIYGDSTELQEIMARLVESQAQRTASKVPEFPY